jgi:16S rRNA (uracil1498-N3)-methyltransferase
MLPRFFAADLQPAVAPTVDTIALSAEESGHLARVLRLGVGARVLVFDGRGHQYEASVAAIEKSKGTVMLNVLEPVPAAPEARLPIVLAQAVLKGDKMETVIRDATMMGVAVIRPVITQRTVVPRSAADQPGVQTRWHRVAVASAKQCGRAVVPRIEPPAAFEVLLDDTSSASRLILVEPAVFSDRDESRRLDGPLAESIPESALVLIGPEGGWTEEEVARAQQAGFRPLSLGMRTLRAESAPLAALSVLTYAWGL